MSAERNLVDVVDDVLALYGPLLAGLLRYPDANGIRTFIGRDEPTALLMGEDMRGYRDDAFEFLARGSLLPLVEATSEIQESCPAIRRIHEPLSVHIVRGEDGIAHVTAGVHDGLGSVFVHRQAAAFERDGGVCLMCLPATIFISARSEDVAALENVRRAAAGSVFNAAEYMLENDLVLNRSGRDAAVVRRFLSQFPIEQSHQVQFEDMHDTVLRISTVSCQDMAKLLVTEPCWETFGDGIDGCPVVRIEDVSDEKVPSP